MPYFSVIVPTHNSARTLEDCLRGIRNSLYKDYELIVVDCGSHDATRTVAERYADRIVALDHTANDGAAREAGIHQARGDVIVNVDSDAVVRNDTLSRIAHFFLSRKEATAVTGLLAKEHPHRGYFSQYKNLYMHYIFKKLPERIRFLYGSLFAFRRDAAQYFDNDFSLTNDTAFGQRIASSGSLIFFLRDVEVVHLKRHTLGSFIRNDFKIPFQWARVFLKYDGWRQLGKGGTGFAHASKGQLISVVLAPLIAALLIAGIGNGLMRGTGVFLWFVWLSLNYDFFAFLYREKGISFSLMAAWVTFFDHCIMASGVVCGVAHAIARGVRSPRGNLQEAS